MSQVVPKEVLLWTDLMVLKDKTDQEEIDKLIKSIQADYLQEDKIKLMKQEKDDIEKGAPFQKNILDDLCIRIKQKIFLQSRMNIPWTFAQSIIYRKRYHHQNSTFPDEVFQMGLDMIRSEDWSSISKKKANYRLKDDKTFMLFRSSAKATVKQFAHAFEDNDLRPKWDSFVTDSHIIEHHGDYGVVRFMKMKGLQKKNLVLLLHRKEMGEKLVYIGCSVEHQSVPVTKESKRVKSRFVTVVIEPIEDDHASFAICSHQSSKIAQIDLFMNMYGEIYSNLAKFVGKMAKKQSST
eukprot:TRINITY_DN6789_c0_g1_i1.p1 TRINITY_DN6789_c0_g1~~TRINITY_DN6789_c0_g1_i1.p1  ORF type:complete len:294 (+),score=49.90 TRINITY_DN6789_c0_g1_i1:130-1011(+)